MKTKYVVKQYAGELGYCVVALSLSGLELWTKATSLNQQEMIALAEKLNKEQAEQ